MSDDDFLAGDATDADFLGAVAAKRAQASGKKFLQTRYLPLGGAAPLSVPAGATLQLVIQPQDTMSLRRLVVQPSAVGLCLVDAMVRSRNIVMPAGLVPVEILDALSTEENANYAGVVTTNDRITMTFSNPTATAITFTGCFVGLSDAMV